MDASGVSEIAFADIVALHGERSLTPETERDFTAAFVVVSATPAPQSLLEAVKTWAEVLAGERRGEFEWLSFGDATTGLATLDTQLGPQGAVADFDQPAEEDHCDSVGQDCATGYACYGFVDAGALCCVAGKAAEGEPCDGGIDCQPGLACRGPASNPEATVCTPYCAYESGVSGSCDTTCEVSFTYWEPVPGQIYAICNPPD